MRASSVRELIARVDDVRTALVRAQQVRTLLVAAGVALAAAITLRAVLAAIGGASTSGSAQPIWLAVAALLGGALAWWRVRPRHAPTRTIAALWVEERLSTPPSFALVTLVEHADGSATELEGTPLAQASLQILQRAPVSDALAQLRWSAWRGPLLFAVAATVVLSVSSVWQGVVPARVREAIAGTQTNAADAPTPLGAWRVRITPPAYAGGSAQTLGDVATVSALAGSVVELQGEGAAPDVLTGRPSSPITQPVAAQSRDGNWSARVLADSAPTTLQVSRAGQSRLLVIEGHADTIPSVSLDAPVRDSVFREARGTLALAASARDDIGLTRAAFELIVSSGEGERFTVRTVSVGTTTWPTSARQRQATVRATLDIATLKLIPGDIVHLRAVARDGHPSPSRDLGSSETRVFRIAKPNEYDSVAVEPAPPPEVDKSLLSQRMLLMLTEKLDKQQRRMVRADVVRESQKLARDQARLRLAVGDVIFQRLSGESSAEHAHFAGDGHDHGVDQQGGKLGVNSASSTGMLEEGNDSPVVAINKPLLEAYNAMWDAGRALEQGDPHGAIPPMRLALEAIERSRAASRVYLRGRPPQVIIDIAKVRLVGKDTGLMTQRSTRSALPRRDAERDARLVSIAQSLATAGGDAAIVAARQGAARDSLALLRVESLSDAPAFAESLGRVLTALERGEDLTPLLVDARRTLGNVERATVGRWSRVLPP